MEHMRVVCIIGARQTGKTTLAGEIARRIGARATRTLDDLAELNSAHDDPMGFVARLQAPAVIDEIQRAPELMLAIKERVDADRTRGQFLITGSANLTTLVTAHDTLPGRAVYVRLRPFSQCEIEGRESSLVSGLFDGEAPAIDSTPVGIDAYIERMVVGGYPEAVGKPQRVRDAFFRDYVAMLIARDIEDVARVDSREGLDRLLRILAARSAGLLNLAAAGREVGLNEKTVKRYARVLESIFLLERIPAWSKNISKRQVKMPKAVITDTGLLANLVGMSSDRLATHDDGRLLGTVVETFVVNEIAKLCDLQAVPVRIFHFRDRTGREIDLLIERNDGSLVAIEVKASATVKAADFRHIEHLQRAVGDDLKAGIVFYAGASTLPFGPRRFAVPLAALWN